MGAYSEDVVVKKVKTLMLFSNGAVTAFADGGAQIPSLQKNLLCEYLRELRANGYIDSSTSIELANGHCSVRDLIGGEEG